MYRPLQPVAPRAHDKRCLSQLVRDNARLASPLEGHVNGRHLCGASRSGPVPTKLGWRLSARSEALPNSYVFIALPRGGVSTQRMGSPAIQGCARKSQRLAEVGKAAQRRIAQASKAGCFADGRRSRSVKNAALDGAAVGGGLRLLSWGVGLQIPALHGRGATESVRGRMMTFALGRQRR
jgi:hypothetical protein